MLRQRMDSLEQESSDLADRLIQVFMIVKRNILSSLFLLLSDFGFYCGETSF